MNAHQVKALQRLTAKLADRDRYTFDGTMSFRIVGEVGDTIIFSATNENDEMPWYGIYKSFFAHIGPRGGVKKFSGNISL